MQGLPVDRVLAVKNKLQMCCSRSYPEEGVQSDSGVFNEVGAKLRKVSHQEQD